MIKSNLKDKIQTEINSAIAQILNIQLIINKPIAKQQIVHQPPPIQPRFVTRYTDDLLPENKKAQNQQFPLKTALSYDYYIVGVKNYPSECSWQFILNN